MVSPQDVTKPIHKLVAYKETFTEQIAALKTLAALIKSSTSDKNWKEGLVNFRLITY
jgi:hypothetical protein